MARVIANVSFGAKARIAANHPVREAFAGCSTCSKCSGCGRVAPYYETKGAAVCAFDEALAGHGFCLDPDDLADFPGDNGRRTVRVLDGEHGDVGFAVLFWYRMPSGRYEFTGYLA